MFACSVAFDGKEGTPFVLVGGGNKGQVCFTRTHLARSRKPVVVVLVVVLKEQECSRPPTLRRHSPQSTATAHAEIVFSGKTAIWDTMENEVKHGVRKGSLV